MNEKSGTCQWNVSAEGLSLLGQSYSVPSGPPSAHEQLERGHRRQLWAQWPSDYLYFSAGGRMFSFYGHLWKSVLSARWKD